MCSFSISEPIKTDKTTYMHCQSKSPKSHRYNFSSRLSVLLKVKPLTIFFCVALIFRCRSPQNHRYFLGKFWLGGFFGFAHRKTTDTIWSKIWDWFFPWYFPDGRSAISSTTKTFFYFNVIWYVAIIDIA